ncbi:MAG TPA: glycosyltransferase family 39 protein [Pyrinomonadaceae bacterium]|nr:glycosyltransferase family 39 protein [Pyrinomonadaceae bacterium]
MESPGSRQGPENVGSAGKIIASFQRNRAAAFYTIAAVVLYVFYIYGLSSNPPGFYIDETLAAYNAYQIYLTGQGEFGHFLPLYFPVLKLPPPHDYLGWMDPVQIYSLAALFFVFPPSNLLPRLLSATAMFLACVLLGRLAVRISGKTYIGIAVFLTALVTPWLFETGRLAFGASLYPLAVALFLTALYSAHKHDRWPWLNVAAVAACLGLLTYTYSIGRLLGPLLAFGLIVFVTDRSKVLNVIKTWAAYGIALIPIVIFHFRNPGALAGRFNMTVGVITPEKTLTEIIFDFVRNFAANVSPYRMLFTGDPNMRHHIMDTGPILAATLVLALLGIVVILIFHRNSPWWRYVLFGLGASVVPASLTLDQFHMLRLIAFPVFLLMLLVPAAMWLVEWGEMDSTLSGPAKRAMPIGHLVLAAAVAFTLIQAAFFYRTFAEEGPKRGLWFDESYPAVLQAALAMAQRPIYLFDGYWGQMYLHSYWYATVHGIDKNNFVHVDFGKRPPPGSLVLSSEEKCTNCEMIMKDGNFLLYRERPATSPK